MLSEHKPGERLNLIGYSGGATPVANAACLLSRRGVSINNLVTIGAVTFRSRLLMSHDGTMSSGTLTLSISHQFWAAQITRRRLH